VTSSSSQSANRSLDDLSCQESRYALTDARLPGCLLDDTAGPADAASPGDDGLAAFDLVIAQGRIEALYPSGSESSLPPARIDLAGRLVLPAFVDAHVHLDKGHIAPRAPTDGTFEGALARVGIDREAHWSATDVEARMAFGLACAWAHGSCAVRTHLDSPAPQDAISWPVFERLRARWTGRIELQAACLAGIDAYRDLRWFGSLVARVADAGGVLGAVTWPMPDLDALLDRMFVAAAEHGLDLDFHADETHDPDSRTLDAIARAALRHRFDGRVLVGHCCSLSRQPDDVVLDTLDRVAEAGLDIVSLPMCNLYLQDRQAGVTPRWRGVTLVQELQSRGIPVSLASDNTRDPFYAYGDLDPLEVLRQGTRIAHLDHPFGDWAASVAARPAEALGLAARAGRIGVGRRADLVVCRGRDWSEVLSRTERERTVLRDGRAIDTRLPDYAELDPLMNP